MLSEMIVDFSSKRALVLIMGVALLNFGLMTGCDKSDSSTEESATRASENKKAPEEAGDSARFDESMKEKYCDLLTADMVAKAFDVPADKLQQEHLSKHMPCTYEWESEGKELRAEISSIQIYDSAEKAASYFNDATRSMSSEDVKKAMKKVKAQAEKEGKLDTEAKKKAAGALGEGMAFGDLKFEKVEGVGDQASFDMKSVALKVRVDNMLFTVSGYYGPPVELPPGTGLQDMLKVVTDFNKKTAPERKAQSIELAKLVVANL